MGTEHALVRIEAVGLKHRFVCACGYVGIPVGCPSFPGEEWADIAYGYHATQLDYSTRHNVIKVSP